MQPEGAGSLTLCAGFRPQGPESAGWQRWPQPFADSILTFLEENRGEEFRISSLEEFIEQDFKKKKLKQEPLFAPLALSDHEHGDFWLRPRFDVVNELDRLLAEGELAYLPQFIEAHLDELHTRRKLKYAQEQLEKLAWQHAQKLADGPALLDYLEQFLHAKNDHPEKAVKLLREWVTNREEVWAESGEDSAHWEQRYKTAKKELDKAKKEVASANASQKEIEALKKEIANLKRQHTQTKKALEKAKKETSSSGDFQKEIDALKAENDRIKKQAAASRLSQASGFFSKSFGSEGSSNWKPITSSELKPKDSDVPVPEMVLIGAGLCNLDSGPMVMVPNFYLGKYPVTQREWEAVMGSNPSHHKGENNPVENVSWHDCQEYIKKLNEKTGLDFRLPYEAEWEYAAGGGTADRTNWAGTSERLLLGQYAWFSENSKEQLQPVGLKKANPKGLFDMSGNVWEWCHDWFAEITEKILVVHGGPENGEQKVVRGGSYLSDDSLIRVGCRNGVDPNNSHKDLGFRLARPAAAPMIGE